MSWLRTLCLLYLIKMVPKFSFKLIYYFSVLYLDLQFSFPIISLLIIATLPLENRKHTLFFDSKRICARILFFSSLNVWNNALVLLSESGDFFIDRFLLTSYSYDLINLIFRKVNLFHPDCQIYWYKVAHNVIYILDVCNDKYCFVVLIK